MSTTKFVFNPFTGNLDEMVNTIDLTSDVTGILPVANGGTGLSSLLQAGSSLYVDNNRTDTYTADGSSSKPFKTLAAALAQVITNNTGGFYTIIVNAGDYSSEDISLNDPAFVRIAIVAASVSNGQLSGDPIPVTAIRDITSTTNNDNLKALLISGFVFRNLTMIGASNGSTFCQYGAMISNCTQLSTATVSIDVENAGQVVFSDCGFSQSSGAGNVTVQNVIALLVYKSLFSVGTMSIITNAGFNKPSGFGSTSTQFSFGSLAGTVNVDAGSAFRTRWNRVLATISNSGTMASIMANFIGAVTINSGGTWSSTGDLVNSVPTNAGTITPTGVMYASGAKLGSLSASSPVLSDANKNLISGSIALASQVSGTLPATNGGTAQSTYTTGDTLYASASNTLSKLTVGSTGDVLTVAGGVPTWAAPAGGGSAVSWSGYHDISYGNWYFNTTAYTDPTSQDNNGNAIVTVINNGFGTVNSLVSGSAKYPGITFTNPVAGRYRVSCTLPIIVAPAAGQIMSLQLTDGTTVIDSSQHISVATSTGVTFTGIVYFSTVASRTVKIQAAASSGSGAISNTGGPEAAMARWSIENIDSPAASIAVTNWSAYTPTITGLGTVSGLDAKYRQVGNSIEVNVKVSAGTPSANPVSVTLPGGFTIDSSQLNASNLYNFGTFWVAATSLQQINTSSGGGGIISNVGNSATTVGLAWRCQTQQFVYDDGSTFLASGDLLSFNFSFIHA